MENVVTLVLGGGQGTRLYPLTKVRSKPAVPVAGKYRLIDIPMSNCINSGLNRIYVLTQFNSTSLHRHIRSTYIFDAFNRGFVEILAAQQTLDNANWYQGTADAVRQNLRHIEQPEVRLRADPLGRSALSHELSAPDRDAPPQRRRRDDRRRAGRPPRRPPRWGSCGVDDSGRVVGFLEKPQTKEELDLVRTDPAWIDAHGVASSGRDCLASMGIYLFNRETLVDALEKTAYRDFGKEVFPASMRTHRVQCHLFDGYWEDIGTIKSFFEANLQLADPAPALRPLGGRRADLHAGPASCRRRGSTGRRSAAAWWPTAAASRKGAVIENSIVGLRCLIGRNATIRNSILMGNDFYEAPDEIAAGTATAGRRWASAAARTSKARSSTRTAASAARCAIANAAAWTTAKRRPSA